MLMDGYIQIDALTPSTQNPRKMVITKEIIERYRDTYGICRKILSGDKVDVLEPIISAIRTKDKLSKGAEAELRYIINFACSLNGKPENLLNPIRYINHGTEKEVSIGSNRYLAHLLMGADKIKAESIVYDSIEDRISAELDENLQRNDLSQIDMMLGLKHLQDVTKGSLTVTDIMIKTNRSRGTANQLQQILKYPSPLLFQMVADRYFKSINAAAKASKLSHDELKSLYDGTVTLPDTAPKTVIKVQGSGRDMDAVIFMMNDLYSYLWRHNDIDKTPSNIGTDGIHAQLRALHARIIALSVKDDNGKYNYDKDEIQAVMNTLFSFYQDTVHQLQAFAVEESVTLHKA